MPIDPNIVLGIRNPQEVALDYEKIVGLRQQNQADQQTLQRSNFLQQLLAQPDAIDTSTGLPTTNTLAKVTRVDPTAGLKLATEISQIQERKVQGEHLQSETATARQKANTEALSEDLALYDAEMTSGGFSPQIAEQNLRKRLKDYIDKQPVSEDEKRKVWDQMSAMKPEQLRVLATTSQQRIETAKLEKERTPMVMGGNPVLVDKLGNVYDPNSGQKIKVTAPLQKEGAALDPERAAMDRERLGMAERAEKLREKVAADRATGKPNLAPDTLSMMADQYLSGDKSVFQNLGRGAQGAADIAALREEVTRQAKQRGMSGSQIATSVAEFAGLTSGERALGTRTANVGMAVTEARSFAALSKEAYTKLPRTAFVPFNKLAAMAETNVFGTPEQAAAFAADNSFINAYARAVNPSGVPTESDKHHAREMLNTAQSPAAHDAVLDQLEKEMDKALTSPESVRQSFRDSRPEGGAAAAKAAAGELAHPASKADYDALPSGAHYVRPGDKPGTYRIKP